MTYHHHRHHLSPIRLFLWLTYFMSYIIIIVIASSNLTTATLAITTLTSTTIATTTTATATIHLDSTVSSSIDNRYDDRRRVDTIPAIKYQRTIKHTLESIEMGGHTTPKQGLNNPKQQGLNNPKQGLNNPKQQGMRYPALDNTNPSTVNHHQTITASVVRLSPKVPTIIYSNHHTLDHKTSTSTSHNHHHHHHRNEISNITICPHTYPFPAVEGTLLSNSMKGIYKSYYIGVWYMIHAYNW